jgi:predicted adenylyl cyclase CyaB
MKEIEIKIIEIDRKKVEDNLATLGAVKTFDGDVETWFFDFHDHTISRASNLLRLRRIGDRTDLTFKKFVGSQSAKVRDEYEVSVSDFRTMSSILESLGLLSTSRMRKHRASYRLRSGVKVEIDKYTEEYSHIPDLLEIEGKDVETLHLHAKLLGFKPEECRSWTTFELMDYYSARAER